jgi:hypothetical protein
MDTEPGAAGQHDQEPATSQQLSGPSAAGERGQSMRDAENQQDRRDNHQAGGQDCRQDPQRCAQRDDPNSGSHCIGSRRQVMRQVHP